MYGSSYERAANFLRATPDATDALARLHLEHRILDDLERETDSIHQRVFDLTGRKERILSDLSSLDQRKPASANHGVATWDARERDRLAAELEAVKAEISRLSARRSALAPRCRALKQRTETMKRFINAAFGSATKLALDPIEPPARQHLAVAFAEAREKTNQLVAEREEISRAPQTLAETKAQVATEVASLAEQGRPYLVQCFEGGPIRWNTDVVASDLDAGIAAGGELSLSAVKVVNAAALVCFLHQDALLKKLNAELDALADDKHSMSAADKAKALAKNTSALRKARYAEEALAFAALKDGINIELRADAGAEEMLSCRK